jgi:hypothetical protein
VDPDCREGPRRGRLIVKGREKHRARSLTTDKQGRPRVTMVDGRVATFPAVACAD